jgi:hypothetical protein
VNPLRVVLGDLPRESTSIPGGFRPLETLTQRLCFGIVCAGEGGLDLHRVAERANQIVAPAKRFECVGERE